MDLSILKELLKGLFQDLFGPLYEPIKSYVFGPIWLLFAALFDTGDRLFLLYLASSLFVAFVVYILQRDKAVNLTLSNFFRFIAPKDIYAHRSSIVDYKYYVTNVYLSSKVYLGFSFLGILSSAQLSSNFFKGGLATLFGETGPQWEVTLASRIIYSILAFTVLDLGGFFAHFLEHKIPFFWEFHKVHHSAETLTPVTAYRNHPMDKMLETILTSSLLGITLGVFRYLYAGSVQEFTILSISPLLFVYFLLANLRHSHIWISYGRHLSYIFSSPAMHQIHHSTAAKHFDKNYAVTLSLWDYLAGSLYIPKEREDITYGLSGQENRLYDRVWKLYFLPFAAAFSTLWRPREIIHPAVEEMKK